MANCLLFAFALFWRRSMRRLRAWRNGVTYHPSERYYLIRASRVRWGLFHVLIGRLDRTTNQVKIVSFKPETLEKVSIELMFKGRVVRGDSTELHISGTSPHQ